jgi:Glycosyl hydrolases family 35
MFTGRFSREHQVRVQGNFDFKPFFDAASEAGIYLLARPGPSINAEVSGGGFPGWLQRIPGTSRTNDTSCLDATDKSIRTVGKFIADAQITNGGPVILLQPENEYANGADDVIFPNGEYFAYIEKQLHDAGIVVPLISNDASPKGIFAPANAQGLWTSTDTMAILLVSIVQIPSNEMTNRCPPPGESCTKSRVQPHRTRLSNSKEAHSILGAVQVMQSV